MWRRHLLLFVFAVGTVGAVSSLVWPWNNDAQHRQPRSVPRPPADLTRVVAQIDAAFAADWASHGIEPAAEVEFPQQARRLSLALVGTIPSLEDLRALEQLESSTRLDWWLQRLLADRRHADYLAERLARNFVGVEPGPFLIYRRRRFVSWLADQVHADRPYDALVRELIASDGLWTSRPATNFITAAIPPMTQRPDTNQLAGRVARSMLGVRIDCAQCHDHPFEDWTQQDFAALGAFFAGTEQAAMGIHEMPAKARQAATMQSDALAAVADVPYENALLPDQGPPRARLAEWVTAPANRAFARAAVNRTWALLLGRPLMEPLDDLPLEGPFPVGMELLTDDFIEHGYSLRRLIQVIARTRVMRLDSRLADAAVDLAEHEAHWAVFPITPLRSEQMVESVLQAASLASVDYEAHFILRLARQVDRQQFVQRYGDHGEEEFTPRTGTIPQRLLLMNGDLVKKTTGEDFANTSARIAALAPDDTTAIEIAYQVALTREPTDDERQYFVGLLHDTKGKARNRAMEDLCWVLVNSTEFACNH